MISNTESMQGEHVNSSVDERGMSIHICNIGMSWKLDVEWNDVKVDPVACAFLDQFDHFYIASTLSENL